MPKPLTVEEREEKLNAIRREAGLITLHCIRPSCRSERLASWKISGKKRRYGNALYLFRCLDCKRKFSDVAVRRMPEAVMYVDVNDKPEVRNLKMEKITSREAIKNLENMRKEEKNE